MPTMSIQEQKLYAAIEELADRPAPPSAIDADDAIRRGHRVVRRRRVARGATGAVVGIAAVAVAVSVLPSHGSSGTTGTGAANSSTKATPQHPSGPGTDPLTLSGTFGWLPTNVANVGYSLHETPNQVQAVARGDQVLPSSDTPMIWLNIYPKGTTPTLGQFAGGNTQLRVNAPKVNGQTAYWMTESASDPTNAGDTWLRWQSPDGQWGELHAYSLDTPDITTELLRVAAGIDFAPHSVPLPMSISGLPKSAVTVEADLDRPSLSGDGAWDLALILQVGGATVQISVDPGTQHSADSGTCKTANGLTACVLVTSPGGLPTSLAKGGAAGILDRITLLGTDPANWTTAVVQQ